MSAAVTRAKQLGVKALAAPTAGNAVGALAAYAAAAGIPAVIVMPAGLNPTGSIASFRTAENTLRRTKTAKDGTTSPR